MSKDINDEIDLPIYLGIDWTVGSVNSQKTRVYGVCLDVPVTVEGITSRCRFYVLENLSEDIILSRLQDRVERANTTIEMMVVAILPFLTKMVTLLRFARSLRTMSETGVEPEKY